MAEHFIQPGDLNLSEVDFEEATKCCALLAKHERNPYLLNEDFFDFSSVTVTDESVFPGPSKMDKPVLSSPPEKAEASRCGSATRTSDNEDITDNPKRKYALPRKNDKPTTEAQNTLPREIQKIRPRFTLMDPSPSDGSPIDTFMQTKLYLDQVIFDREERDMLWEKMFKYFTTNLKPDSANQPKTENNGRGSSVFLREDPPPQKSQTFNNPENVTHKTTLPK